MLADGSALVGAPGPAPLDLHEGIALTPSAGGCERWPKALRLLGSDGTLVAGRCRATNLCRYCQALYVVETVECLTLDALSGEAPTVWVVLTAREHLSRSQLNEHLRMARQWLKRRGWRVEWFVQVEFQRRGALHANLLVKGVAAEDAERFLGELRGYWCDRVDAEPVGQWAEAIADALAVSRYCSKMLAHGLKREQAPPIGWRGHRTSHTRGYFGRPMWQVRRDARESLQAKRELRRALDLGLTGAEVEVEVAARLARAERTEWQLVAVTVEHETGELLRVRPAIGRDDLVTAPARAGRDFVLDAFCARAARAMDEVLCERSGGRSRRC